MYDYLGGGDFTFSKDVNNSVSARNVYPTNQSPTSGQRASAMTPFATGAGMAGVDEVSDVSDNGGGGVFGKPLAWWGILLVLLVALMWTAKRAGAGGEFSNIKLSVYNILTIALAAAVGFGFLKVVFTRFKVPGLSTYIQAL